MVSAGQFAAGLSAWLMVVGLAIIATPHLPAWFMPWSVVIGVALLLIHALQKPDLEQWHMQWLL